MANKYCGTCLALAADEPCKDCDNYSRWTSRRGYSAELSRLRDLVKEMREALLDTNSLLVALLHGEALEQIEAQAHDNHTAIAKADTILKEPK